MPVVKPITEAQKLERRYQQKLDWIADGIAAYKRKNQMTNEEAAAKLCIGESTIAKVLKGEEVKLPSKSMLRLLYAAGLTVERRREESL